MKLSLIMIGGNNNLAIKILSLIFGYFFWLILVQNQKIVTSTKVEVCFYDLKDDLEIAGPDNIDLKLSGKRLKFANLDLNQVVAIHVDASKYNQKGEYSVKLLESDIFLQNGIKLLDYFPSEITIQVKEKK